MSNPFDLLLEAQEGTSDSWRWATVTSTNPLRIRLDQDTADLPVPPVNLAGPVSVGLRVWVQMHRARNMQGARPIIIGPGAPPAPHIPARTIACSSPPTVPSGTWMSVASGYVGRPGDSGNIAGGIQFGAGTLTVPVPGTYQVSVAFTFTAETRFQRSVGLLVNGEQDRITTALDPATLVVSGEYNMPAGGTFQAQLFQSSGVSRAPNGGAPYNWISCALVSRE